MKMNSENRFVASSRVSSVQTQSRTVHAARAKSSARNAGGLVERDESQQRRRPGQVLPPAPIMFSVALQPDDTIAGMNRAELIDLIRLADLPPVSRETFERLDYLGRTDLERLAFLTRRCCRNQINSYSHHVGRLAPFVADM